MWTMRGEGFAVDPGGDFMVYQAVVNGRGELWYRSLLDATTRRIAGTEDGWQPTISPDGTQIAFLHEQGQEWNLVAMPVNGGSPSTLGRGAGFANLQWLPDGRVFVVEGDGNRARWFDPGGGPTTARGIPYCTMPSPAIESDVLICSGGGGKTTRRIDTRDSNRTTVFWTDAGDSAQVFGSHFRLINRRYLTYLTVGGDLAAAPVDLSTGEVGRSVRMATGLGRREFTSTGTYAVSASGTLVYALGTNRVVGHLVRAGDQGLDTLPVGRAAFLRFAMNPDGRRLAAVVETLEGEELRIYDLRTGEHQVWARSGEVRQPVWSPSGDRLLYSTWSMTNVSSPGSIFLGSPGRAGPPQSIHEIPGDFEAFGWIADGRVVGVLWSTFIAVALQVDQRPLKLDSLLTGVGFVQPSPDGRWIAYNPPELNSLWLEPLPRDGRRYQIAAGNVEDARWLSPTELIYSVLGNQKSIYRVRIVPSEDPPLGERRRWLDLPDFRETEGQSFNLTPDRRVLYVRGTAEIPARYLRVIPNWVEQMERAVDEANR
jgi:dipeptidyl aminopeptidase/acylaminoacyl peptidase